MAALAAGGVPRRARAAAPAAAAPDAGAASAERLRLRAELDRVNAEIDALKRAHRGVGDDYRLRARLADAEALARRLVDLERRMGLTAPASEPRPVPTASPADGPGELAAKADILTDQSRRVRAAADALDVRLTELKGRQELRRRAAELDHDPFAPLEGSRRRTLTIAAGTDSGSHTVSTPTAGPSTNSGGTVTGDRGAPTGSTLTGVGSTSAPTSAPAIGTTPAAPGTPVATTAPLALSLELRDLLDPATVADIGRAEHGRVPSSVAALQRAVTVLRARAAVMDAQARSMRAAAQKP